jgi:hypothetical protein
VGLEGRENAGQASADDPDAAHAPHTLRIVTISRSVALLISLMVRMNQGDKLQAQTNS